ncbi:MAG: hypothetical protein QT11_C0001G0128 [archaeon GW2011_AR20]|nr:MAG: hypothetical protein QT11_C0001G0128 [archaeon GW2011_AR20]MBS3160698.1 hypothetical protein [Candidatus Woesearchaeota archaeon]
MGTGKYVCDSCGFTWDAKTRKPETCPNCDGKMIKPSKSFLEDSGIESF